MSSNIRSRLISTNQGTSAGAATSLVIAPAGVDVTVLDYSGYCYGTANTQYWVMFFAQSTVPPNGTQPLYKEQVLGSNGFKFNYMPKGISAESFMTLNSAVQIPNQGGLIAVLSTTAETLTIATGEVNMDLDVFIEDYETLQAGTILVGDTTMAVKSLQVWSEANGTGKNNLQGARQLLKVWATNKSDSTQYLQLFAQDDPVTNSATLGQTVYLPVATNPVVGGAYVPNISVNSQLVPIEQWTIPPETAISGTLVIGTVYTITAFVSGDDFTNVGAPNNATGVQFVATGTTPATWTNSSLLTATVPALNFGDANSGIIPLSIDDGTTTIRRGCSLFVSRTQGYLTRPVINQWTLQALYK